VPTREDHPLSPQYPYALSKYQGEQAVFHWHQVYGLPVNSIRIFNAYGTRSRTSGAYGAVFGVFLRQNLRTNRSRWWETDAVATSSTSRTLRSFSPPPRRRAGHSGTLVQAPADREPPVNCSAATGSTYQAPR
jgi:hypothetical protein